MNSEYFQTLRDQWALKAPTPSDSDIQLQHSRDRQANPYNDTGPNKPPLRDIAEIISDLAYRFADIVLANQYPAAYPDWMQQNGYRETHGRTKKTTHFTYTDDE